jgi:hypothetical protein
MQSNNIKEKTTNTNSKTQVEETKELMRPSISKKYLSIAPIGGEKKSVLGQSVVGDSEIGRECSESSDYNNAPKESKAHHLITML